MPDKKASKRSNRAPIENPSGWRFFKKKIIPEIEKFLKEIHGKAVPNCIWKAVKHGKKGAKSFSKGPFSSVQEWLYLYNFEWKYEIFYSIHPYEASLLPPEERRKNRVNKWRKCPARCFVLDVDCGTSKEQIKANELKVRMSLCQDMAIPPNHVIHSRNGFHLYWTITEDIDDNTWVFVQKKLAEIFNGDPKICSPVQDMRLPLLAHWKGENEPFPVVWNMIDTSPSYSLLPFMHGIGLKTIEDFEGVLDEYHEYMGIPKPFDASILKQKRTKKKPKVPVPGKLELPIVVDAQLKSLNPLSSYEEIGGVLNKIRSDKELLLKYLGVSPSNLSKFKCPFHDDRNPSAGIKNIKGNYVFKCFAKCTKGDIIELIKKKEGLEGSLLIQRVLGFCEMRLEEFSKKKGWDAYLDRNISFLLNPPPIYNGSYTKNDQKLLSFIATFNEASKGKLKNEDLKFAFSLGEIAKKTGHKREEVSSRKLYMGVYMGLVNRLTEQEIPVNCLEETKAYSARKCHKNIVSWWTIPEYTEDLMKEALIRLKCLRSHKINTLNLTAQKIKETLGQDVADLMFVGTSAKTKRSLFSVDEDIPSTQTG
jgi:hypothetical protein